MVEKDSINKLYKISEILNKINIILFFLNAVLSVALLFFEGTVKGIFITIQIGISILFLISTVVNDGWLWYEAESVRRKDNIQNAFGVTLQEFKTEGYYNNVLPPSWFKYVTNTFESVFFSKKIASKMMLKKIIVFSLSILLLVLLSQYNENGDLILIISQIVFSSYFILDTLMFFAYYVKVTSLYDKIYNQVVTIAVTSKEELVLLMFLNMSVSKHILK